MRPIQNNWYDTNILKYSLSNIQYDVILADGPKGPIGRYKFYDNFNLFNKKVPIVFDDVNRSIELS